MKQVLSQEELHRHAMLAITRSLMKKGLLTRQEEQQIQQYLLKDTPKKQCPAQGTPAVLIQPGREKNGTKK